MLIPSKTDQETKTPIVESVNEEPSPAIDLLATPTTSSVVTMMPSEIVTQAQTGAFLDDHGVEMVWIPAGSFMMGSEDGDGDEQPIHEVYVDTYAIDVYEVTYERYEECLAVGVCDNPCGSNYGGESYDDHPVVYVSWNDASSYCKWRGGRLPTEAEWEKAARGGLVGKKYPWGDEEPTCQKGVDNGAQYDDCYGETAAVGSFAANGYGVYDMAGNVWEWVADWYDPGYYGKSEYENPTGPTSGDYRALRGGGWYPIDNDLRSAYRYYYDPSDSHYGIGFRCGFSSTSGK